MTAQRLLIAPDESAAPTGQAVDAPGPGANSDFESTKLIGFGFIASLALAAVAVAAALARGAHTREWMALWPCLVLLAALLLVCAHVWSNAMWTADAGHRPKIAPRHRLVLMTLWLVTVVATPAAALLAFGGDDVRDAGVVLAATALGVAGMAICIRQIVSRALNVRIQNELLVQQLKNQVSLVEAANAEKSRFLGAASHDLRQPMHALGLFATAIEKELRGTEQHPKLISMVSAVNALEDSFNAMLDLSRLDAGIVRPKLQSFPIRDVYRRLHMYCAAEAEARGLSLRFKAGGKLVTSDPQLLERILSNLVHNAIRYTEHGGVVIVTRTRGRRTSIEIWDSGVGIGQEELPKIFNEFYQVENPGRDRTRGLGMGLSIVKRLVLLLGHELELTSVPGRGTAFRVLLQSTELAEMESVVLGADTIPQSIDEGRTVLVLDDEPAVREGMKELLGGWGFLVLLASTIDEATLAVRRHAGLIDVVVSDLRLGGGENGIHAISEIRRQYGGPLPAILVTGDTSASEVKRAHESGYPVLFKPVRPRDLFAALRSAP